MLDKAVNWMIVLGMTYLIMAITITAEPQVQIGMIAGLFLMITSLLSKPQ